MRFQRRDTGQGSEFRIIDVPGELLPAVRKTAFTDGGDHWHRAFPADTPHLDRAWANFQRLIEPVVPADWFCRWWGRAMLGARVEFIGGVGPAADQPEVTDFGPVAATRLETVRWREHTIRVPPVELQRAVSARRRLRDRVRLIDA